MLYEIKEMQSNAVNKIIDLLRKNDSVQSEYTFKSPTGSGKTHMIAELMDKMLSDNKDLIFIVSSLSTSNLARQNYEKFLEYGRTEFRNINPFEIISDSTPEERISINTNYNVYVLARDLYKKDSKLMSDNSLIEFLDEIIGQGKEIIWIKDESHIASKNLDFLKKYFKKVLNLSATPKTKPDVLISELEAVNKKLIKSVEYHDEDLEDYGIGKFLTIRNDYKKLLNINPCLIIQISNKDKGEDEWNKIKTVLDTKYAGVQYVCFANDQRLCQTNSDILNKTKKSDWKNIVKDNNDPVSVIIFKMVIKEGYDIPRACMLYQVRDVQSETLDEQVIGRIRRNPILVNWEDFSLDAQKLALKAIVYGVEKKQGRLFKKASVDLNKNFIVKTTKLNDLWDENKSKFNLKKYISANEKNITENESIFDLYRKWKNVDDRTNDCCWQYIGNNIDNWFKVSNLIEKIKNENNNYKADYSHSMVLNEAVKFCKNVIYEIVDEANGIQIEDWLWTQTLNNEPDYEYYFDSKAERSFAMLIKDCGYKIWGKNFYTGIDEDNKLCFQYIDYEDHNSYPDFILKVDNTVHIFEAKSLIGENNEAIDSEQYKKKIEALKMAYKHASKLTLQCFYLAVRQFNSAKTPVWNITKYFNGKEKNYPEVRTSSELKKIIIANI